MDKQIYVSKLGCIISPYRKRQSPLIEQRTAIYDKVYHKWIDYVGFILPYRGRNCFITYNRPLSMLSKAFKDYAVDKLPEVPPHNLSRKLNLRNIDSFREAQTEIINNIEDHLYKQRVWFVNLQTGIGKTVLSAYLSTVINYKTWILCFSDDILNQWVKTYLNNTDIDPSKILKVTGSIIDKILAGEIDPEEFDVFLCTPTLLDRLGSRRSDYGKIDDLFRKCHIGLMIYDEAHRNVSNIVKITSVTDVKYQIYLSADFGQGSYEKELMYKEIFKSVPILTPNEELQKSMKYTKLIIVDYNTYPNEIEKEEPFNKYGYSAELYMQYQFKKGTIQKAIIHVINSALKANDGYRILVLFNNIAHVDEMYLLLRDKYPNIDVGRFYGSMSNKKEKEHSKDHSKIIVATYGSFSTGLDASNIKYVLSTNQCNKVADNQSAGRARPLSDGSDAMYFMFVDNGFPYCRKKLKVRLSYLCKTKSKSEQPYHFTFHPDVHGGEV